MVGGGEIYKQIVNETVRLIKERTFCLGEKREQSRERSETKKKTRRKERNKKRIYRYEKKRDKNSLGSKEVK